MPEPKTHCTAKELAGLPGMPGTERGVQKLADRENWPWQKRAGRGGGREYIISSLPTETRDYLLNRLIAQLPKKKCNLPAVRTETALIEIDTPALPNLGSLKSWQTTTMDARLVFMRLIEQAIPASGVSKAIKALVKQAADEALPTPIQELVPAANARAGKEGARALSERSLMRWWSTWLKSGKKSAALAPKGVENVELPPWVPYFLEAYRTPQKPSVQKALDNMAKTVPEDIPLPSLHQAQRFIKKYSRLDIQRGRKTGSELASQRSYCERDTSKFIPGDICLCDGHSFKASVAHPAHGRPFKPEVCVVLDSVTRVALGWSAGLAESSQTVADAIRHAVTTGPEKPEGCIPAILYTDKGAGNMAGANADELIGRFPRLGITFKTGRAGNPKGRGRIERPQASIWIRAAKDLPTYIGKDMDKGAARKVYLAIEKDVREARKNGALVKSKLLISWPDFLVFCQETIDDYNRRPHSALPRITDPRTGLRRHMCPLEMWSKFLAEGWKPELPEADELDHLFRPQVQVKVDRCLVRVFGNRYHNTDLEHYQGELVNVAYDIHDAGKVWVRDWEQRLICLAKFEGNKKDFFPVPVVEQAREERRKRRSSTLERRLEEVELEAQGAIELQAPQHIELSQEVLIFEEKQKEKEKKKEACRVYINDVNELYDDIRNRQRQGCASEYEITWADDKEGSSSIGKRQGLYKTDPDCAGRFKKAL